MRDMSNRLIERLHQKRALQRWRRLAQRARTANFRNLRRILTMSQALSEQISTTQNTAHARLNRPTEPTGLPTSTDWFCRPDFWAAPTLPRGHAPANAQTRLSDQVTLYHDCKTPGLCVRQISPVEIGKTDAFGLSMEVFAFDGSFLSLVLHAPKLSVEGLKKTYILRVWMKIDCERPVDISLRLNLQHGPNTEQVSKDVALKDGCALVEFDLAYMPFRENRAEQIWFDLFFEKPSTNAIKIHDLILSRHLRAEV
ncbi:MAG: hypothetical protein GXP05_04620 [Alphaproteobacteria bacterium]|nr:hypothetical protein [Alphaproteobacteria bacterium]